MCSLPFVIFLNLDQGSIWYSLAAFCLGIVALFCVAVWRLGNLMGVGWSFKPFEGEGCGVEVPGGSCHVTECWEEV